MAHERDSGVPATPGAGVVTPIERTSAYSSGAGPNNAEDGMPVYWRPKSRRALLAECKDRSRPAWLYFPHVELLFLLFAFEGAVASQVAALRDGGCPWVAYTAWSALVSEKKTIQIANTFAGPPQAGFEILMIVLTPSRDIFSYAMGFRSRRIARWHGKQSRYADGLGSLDPAVANNRFSPCIEPLSCVR